MHHLLEHHPVPTWSLFFGLILGSILFVGGKVERWNRAALFLVIGTVGAYLIVGMIPRSTPETWWFVFISGMIAICAMILPGISGSFILLILGKYLYVTGALKNPFAEGQMTILVIFGLGAMVGITLFSRVLGFLLKRYSDATIALLTGFMIGAMRKIWPWQEVLREEVIGGKSRVLETRNVLPPALDAEVLLAMGLALAGFGAVLVLERLARSRIAD
jgi:putative membrane protein